MRTTTPKFLIVLATALAVLPFSLAGQGCSDAGLCTAGTLASGASDDTVYRYRAGLAFSYGDGERDASVFNLVADARVQFTRSFGLQVKVPYVMARDASDDNSGIGDVTTSVMARVYEQDGFRLDVTAGMRLPTGTTDAGEPLSYAMPLQTGLGTTDLLLGLTASFGKWKADAGYQRVLHNGNKNDFSYATIDPADGQTTYFESRLLDRADDVLLRVERGFRLDRWTLIPGLLALYRLSEDRVTPELFNESIAVQGSKGLTLNATAAVQYKIGRTVLTFLGGTPLVVRDVRPDGLTRSLVLQAGVQFNLKPL